MTTLQKPTMVGAPDPTLKTSPILEETDEEFDVLSQELDELPNCYFNSIAYADGAYVCSGSSARLRCEKGIWVRQDGCDPDNP